VQKEKLKGESNEKNVSSAWWEISTGKIRASAFTLVES